MCTARTLTLLSLLLAACTSEGDTDSQVGLPDEDTSFQFDTSATFFPPDTGAPVDLDQTPAHTVTMHQWGTLSMSPVDAATYTSLTGTLRVQEYIDGEMPTDPEDTDIEPEDVVTVECDLTYGLEGLPSESAGCPGCDFTFDVNFYLLEGDPDLCNDPDLPLHEAVWRLGYHPGDDRVMRDYLGLGLWMPWYVASKVGDTIELEWQATMGVIVEEEEE